jgi:L-arabinonolactonase
MTARPTEIEIAADLRLELGESILWDSQTKALSWVDIHRGHLWQRPPDGVATCQALPNRVGAIGLRADHPGHVVGLAGEFGLFHPAQGWRSLARTGSQDSSIRLNDGRCDPFGNFLCGEMDESGASRGRLFRLRPDGTLEILRSNITCANSTCFSPDGRVLYFADMPKRRIMAFAYDPEGPLGPARLFFDFNGRPGMPDGSTVDAEGCLWSTHWGAGRITRHAPDGRVLAEFVLPVTNPTCLAFGDDDLLTLFVTTARFQLDDRALAAEPLAGAVLALRPGVKGLAEPRFGG